MGRPHRVERAPFVYHVTTRGNSGDRLYVDDGDYERWLTIFGDVAGLLGWRAHAYCLMPNHTHLLLHAPAGTLVAGMHRLSWRYAVETNRRYDRSNHLHGRRYWSACVDSPEYHRRAGLYIHRNPRASGLVEHAIAYRWSSLPALSGRTARPWWLDETPILAPFARAATPPTAYLRVVNRAEAPPDPRAMLLASLLARGTAGIRDALDADFSVGEIAGALGIHRATVHRRLSEEP
jgi:REP element-mobilizing transposase RayT